MTLKCFRSPFWLVWDGQDSRLVLHFLMDRMGTLSPMTATTGSILTSSCLWRGMSYFESSLPTHWPFSETLGRHAFHSFEFVRPGLRYALLSRGLLAAAAPAPQNDLPPDPCIKIAGLSFVDPADVIPCLDEELRQNVIAVVSRVFDFYTFEDFYLNSPPPFQESTTDIRAEIARINSTEYAVRMFSL